MKMYTDPKRISARDPGTVENNPLWLFHDAFNNDTNWLVEYKNRYRRGEVGDIEIKNRLVDLLNDFLNPIRERRSYFEKNQQDVLEALRLGTERANTLAADTLSKVKKLINQDYF